jgi:polysaccharide biosynthesis protein PslG
VVRSGLAAIAAVLALTGFAAPAGAEERSSHRVKWFGYNEDWASQQHRIDDVSAAGANTFRVVLSWRAVERRYGQLRWSRYDALYARMLANGARPLWVLADAPCWAWAHTKRICGEQGRLAHPPDPAYDLEWARFVYQVVQRYPQTVAIEAWNEPNLKAFFKPAPDPARAATVTAWANWAVDRVDPRIPVLFGGPSPTFDTIPGVEIAYQQFLRDAYAAVGTGHWDGLALHPFPSMRRQGHYLRDVHEHLNNARAIIRHEGARDTPIWVTEIGLSTDGVRPYTAREQATGLRRIYHALARRRDVDVPAVIVHRLVDQPPGFGAPAEAGWGVLHRDGRPKPAFCELAKVRGQRCP